MQAPAREQVVVRPNGLIDSWAVVVIGRGGKWLSILETGYTRAKSQELAARYRKERRREKRRVRQTRELKRLRQRVQKLEDEVTHGGL